LDTPYHLGELVNATTESEIKKGSLPPPPVPVYLTEIKRIGVKRGVAVKFKTCNFDLSFSRNLEEEQEIAEKEKTYKLIHAT
jgi:hypothetical protein